MIIYLTGMLLTLNLAIILVVSIKGIKRKLYLNGLRKKAIKEHKEQLIKKKYLMAMQASQKSPINEESVKSSVIQLAAALPDPVVQSSRSIRKKKTNKLIKAKTGKLVSGN